jgi:hypothetical protein
VTITQHQPTRAKAHEVWVGVDTHRDVNVAVALDERGRRLGEVKVPTDRHGHAELFAWAKDLGHELRGFAVEGTGTYGAGLTRYLTGEGQFVIEATRPRRDRMAQRNDGKSVLGWSVHEPQGRLRLQLAFAMRRLHRDPGPVVR